MNGCFWKMVHYFQHKFYNLPQKKGCRKAVFFYKNLFFFCCEPNLKIPSILRLQKYFQKKQGGIIMKTLIEQFVKEALTGKNQFTFSFGTDCLYAINIKRGKSRFIYGCYSCNLDSCTDVDKLTLHLLAIVKDEWVYLSESVLFKVYTEEDKKKLPENVMMLRDYQQLWKKRREQLVNDYLTQFLRIDLKDISLSKKVIDLCERNARIHLLRGTLPKLTDSIYMDDFFATRQKCIDHLCGFINLEKETIKKIEPCHDVFQQKANIYMVTKKMMEEKSCVSSWELNLCKNLTEKMKTVKVLFEHNGKTAKGSVDTKSLRDVLIRRDMLSVLNFKSTPEGEKVFSELGITNLFGLHSGDGLYCKDIVQITYQNKVLYKRAKN